LTRRALQTGLMIRYRLCWEAEDCDVLNSERTSVRDAGVLHTGANCYNQRTDAVCNKRPIGNLVAAVNLMGTLSHCN